MAIKFNTTLYGVEYTTERGVFIDVETEYNRALTVAWKEGACFNKAVAPINTEINLFAAIADDSGENVVYGNNDIVINSFADIEEGEPLYLVIGNADSIEKANKILEDFLAANTEEEIIGKLKSYYE